MKSNKKPAPSPEVQIIHEGEAMSLPLGNGKIQVLLVPAGAKGDRRLLEVSTLEDLQGLVGGYIEAIGFQRAPDLSAYINEEGKAKGLPVNADAMAICKALGTGLHPHDFIVGDMVILGAPDKDGVDTSIPKKWADKILAWKL